MKYQKIETLPSIWQSVILCSQRREYSRIDHVQVRYLPFFGMSERTYECKDTLLADPSDTYCEDFIKPVHILQGEGDLLVQMRCKNPYTLDPTPGHWFRMTLPYIHKGCESCDGETESSFTIYEYPTLHDLIMYGMDEDERVSFLGNDYPALETYEDSDILSLIYE